MRVRHDAIFVSSVLFTIAFLCLIPATWSNALAGRDMAALAEMDPGHQNLAKTIGEFGVASLAVIFVVLIVIWMGYVKRLRWTWFVMFIIVWAWAFPILILPLLQYPLALTPAQLVSDALRTWGGARDIVEQGLIFSLMLIALIVPVKSFFSRQKTGDRLTKPNERDPMPMKSEGSEVLPSPQENG